MLHTNTTKHTKFSILRRAPRAFFFTATLNILKFFLLPPPPPQSEKLIDAPGPSPLHALGSVKRGNVYKHCGYGRSLLCFPFWGVVRLFIVAFFFLYLAAFQRGRKFENNTVPEKIF